jgi:hypothetical protein
MGSAGLAFLSTRLHAAQHRIHISTSHDLRLAGHVTAQEKQIDFQFSNDAKGWTGKARK